MATKKYVSLSKLSTFLDNLKTKFATIAHSHKLSDITDYTVDTELSSTSTNPVANDVINAEFDAISNAMGALETAIDGKADSSHTHDDRYYTETEIDAKLSEKSDSTHNHDSAYDTKGSADSALASAKEYADSAATTAANTVKNDLLNGAGGAYDTLKELGDLIDNNTDAIDALEAVASGKANAVHTHAISDITNLQTTLDGKAATSHGTHVSYSTVPPVMDDTASVGTATTVARSDHRHPTDTSRASKTEFDSHTSNMTAHITSTERYNWNAAKTHAESAHAPSNAEKNQNAFSNITVGSTTVAADSVTDTVTFVGSNMTITPDATNDKITFAVADGSTSAKGIVRLTNSTSSTSTTTAATPYNVKLAYDLATTARTQAANAQAAADAKLPLSGGTMTGSIITPRDDNEGIFPSEDNWGQIGSADKKFYRMYASIFYGKLSGNATSADSATKATQDGSGNTITSTYATKTEVNNLELITVDDIDTICGAAIQVASLSNEVTF